MKKSLVAAMFAVMMIGLVGCGKAPEPRTVETTEVVEEVTETEEVVEETTETEEVSEPTEATATEEPASPYTYTELSQTMYAQSTVNVRDLPEQTGGKLGSLSTNQEVTVTGQCNETGWYRISYNDAEGFVSDSYLGTEQVAVKSQSTNGSANKGNSTSTSQSASESQPAQEATAAQPEKQPGEVDTSNAVTTDQVLAPGETLTPDVQPGTTCGWCGAVLNSYDEALEHAKTVHNMQ